MTFRFAPYSMSDGVFSGTFEGGRITEGRFDLKYKE